MNWGKPQHVVGRRGPEEMDLHRSFCLVFSDLKAFTATAILRDIVSLLVLIQLFVINKDLFRI